MFSLFFPSCKFYYSYDVCCSIVERLVYSSPAHDAVVTAVVFSPNPSLVLNRIEEGKASRSTDPVREKCDGKLELSEEKTEKRSSLKKMQDQSEVIISADFSGTIKVFIRKVKEKD